ncbi:MAG: TRAP transporter TatT component family protein, partial [Pseudomonadales bacterium]
ASLGGRPEQGRAHFEKALAIDGQYLMTKVVFAEQYARLVFDQALHDRLLTEVLAADAVAPGMTLTNKVAQARARALLETSPDYF